jgi:hypothetical protein
MQGPSSFARAVLSLARCEATGTVHLRTERGRAEIALDEGRIRGIGGPLGSGITLGDALLEDGSLDRARHAAALERGGPPSGCPVGRWLVEEGLVGSGALEAALRWQLRRRMQLVLRCQRLEYRFVRGVPGPAAEGPGEPEPTAALVVAAMRSLLLDRRLAALRVEIPAGPLSLTDDGRRLVRQAVLWPDEQAAARLLERGCDAATLREATRDSVRAERFTVLLSLLGGLRDDVSAGARYGLLLRKRRQLRSTRDPHALLDIPRGASPREQRQALRRLARDLHPDSFGPATPPAIRDASNEVMGALIRAELELRRA